MWNIFQNPESVFLNSAYCQDFNELRNLVKKKPKNTHYMKSFRFHFKKLFIFVCVIYKKKKKERMPTIEKINKEKSEQSWFYKSSQVRYFSWPELKYFFLSFIL